MLFFMDAYEGMYFFKTGVCLAWFQPNDIRRQHTKKNHETANHPLLGCAVGVGLFGILLGRPG